MIRQPDSRFLDDQVCVRFGRGGLLAGEGHSRRVARRDPRIPRHQSHPPQARPLHQRRPGHDEPLPARGGVRHRGRRRDRPGSRPLRALPERQDEAVEQLHHRSDLRERNQERAQGRLPRPHRPGHPAHHRRDQELHRARGAGRRRRDRRDRGHGRRHRVAAVPRGGAPDAARARPAEHLLHPPHARAVHQVGRRDQDQADAALGEGAARDRDPGRRAALPLREAGPGRGAAQDRALHERRRRSGDLGLGRRLDLQDPEHAPPADARRDRLPQARHPGAAGGSLALGQARARARASAAPGHDRARRQVRRSHRVLQVAERGADPRRHPYPEQDRHPLHRLGVDRARRRRRAEGRGRDPRPRRVRQARRRGQDPGDPVRAREPHPVSRHLPRDAARRDRVRAPQGRARRREQHRVRPRHAASGDRADHGVDERRRARRAARRALRPRRHHASRRAARGRGRGDAGEPHLQERGRERAASPSLRGQQPLPAAARGGGAQGGGADEGRVAGRAGRAAGASRGSSAASSTPSSRPPRAPAIRCSRASSRRRSRTGPSRQSRPWLPHEALRFRSRPRPAPYS